MDDSIIKNIEPLLAPGDHAGIFGRLGAEEPSKASSLWNRLLPADATPDRSHAATLISELASCPDIDMALVNLSRFADSTISPSRFLDSIFLERPICHLLVVVLSCSNYLSDILIRNPEYLSWLIEGPTLESTKSYSSYWSELERQAGAFEDQRRRLNSIKRYKRREVLRIGTRDLLGLAPVEEVTAELSLLTDAIVETVARLAYADERTQTGGSPARDPFGAREPYRRFSIISMGKLGGYELNYSSDIDLLFVCDIDGKGDEYGFYTALARRITNDLSSPTEEGSLYRVDLRLRPDGEHGPLVVSLRDHLDYLQLRARPWEKQALLKARFTAGSTHTADEFLENCSRVVFGPIGGIEDISSIRTMRDRAVRGLSVKERESNIKLMWGGIRDIEFIAQALELVHGRSRRDVRSRNTLETLERLHHFGLLEEDAWKGLSNHYRLFRTIEHRLQLVENVQTHTVPTSKSALETLALRVANSALAGIDASNFRSALGKAIGSVRELFASFFAESPSGDIPLILSLPSREREVKEVLGRYGIEEGAQAHRFLSSLVYGDFPRLEGPETLLAAGRSLPVILEEVGRTPAPELTLKNLTRMIKATKAVRSTLELLEGSRDLLRLFLAISALSSRLTGVIERRIELLDAVAEGSPPAPSPPSDSPDAVGRWYEEALLHMHCANPFPGAGLETLAPLLSNAAEAVIERLFALSGAGKNRIAIVALGSLGRGECHLGSDLDLVAVAGEGFDPAPGAEPVRRMIELGRRIGAAQFDFRLRGEGESSPLVQGIDSYRRYLESRAGFWELLAYSQCRFLCGDRETGESFERLVAKRSSEEFSSDDHITNLRRERLRLESLSRGAWDIKHARGGLYDITFIEAVAGASPERWMGSAAEKLETLVAGGRLEAADAGTLLRARRIFYLIEHSAAHHELVYPPIPERERFFEEYLGRLLGPLLPGEGATLERLASIKESVRNVFDRFAPPGETGNSR
jgi:glutamate-ammonia-ligase adenylyltransferase